MFRVHVTAVQSFHANDRQEVNCIVTISRRTIWLHDRSGDGKPRYKKLPWMHYYDLQRDRLGHHLFATRGEWRRRASDSDETSPIDALVLDCVCRPKLFPVFSVCQSNMPTQCIKRHRINKYCYSQLHCMHQWNGNGSYMPGIQALHGKPTTLHFFAVSSGITWQTNVLCQSAYSYYLGILLRRWWL